MACLQAQAQLPALGHLWAGPALILGVLFFPRRSLLQRRIVWALTVLLAFASGYYYAAWRAELRLSDRLEAIWEGRDIEVVGRVEGLSDVAARGTKMQIRIEHGLDIPATALPKRAQVFLPARFGSLPSNAECFHARVRLHRPLVSLNPGLMDYSAWLFEHGIRAQGVITTPLQTSVGCTQTVFDSIDAMRRVIRARLLTALPESPYAGIVTGLAVGDQQAITNAQWAIFRDTGVTHLMSISGLHVTLLSSLVYALTLAIWRRIPSFALRVPARRVAVLSGFVTALAYTALAGFGVPAQRTLYMVGVVGAALWTNAHISPSRVLGAALAVVLLIDPWASLAPGFWLSFVAVAALMYVGAGRLRPPSVLKGWILSQWVVTVALLPLLLAWFHAVSLVSPLANAVAIPLISLVVVPLIFAAVFLPWTTPVILAHTLIGWLMNGLEWLTSLPMPIWTRPMPDMWALVLGGIGVMWILIPGGVPRRGLGAVLLLPLLWPLSDRPESGGMSVRVFDVGQGLAVHVQTAAHNLLYDTGPRYRSGENAGDRVVVPVLQALGVDHLDGLIVSHADSDHQGGADAVSCRFRPAWALSGEPNAALGFAPCETGQTWMWDGVRFEVLHPPRRYRDNPYFDGNNRSCVLRVAASGGSVLLTGDIARLAELELLEREHDHLVATALVVPHHGSAGSSMPAFVSATAPHWAIFSVGANNSFGHPKPEILSRYHDAGAIPLRTDRSGAIELRVVEGRMQVATAKDQMRRYWHGL